MYNLYISSVQTSKEMSSGILGTVVGNLVHSGLLLHICYLMITFTLHVCLDRVKEQLLTGGPSALY